MTTPNTVSQYDPGDLVHTTATFVGSDGVTPADPSQVVWYVKAPWADVASYVYGVAGASVVRIATGAYAKDIDVPRAGTAVGDWFYNPVGTGLIQTAEEWKFAVNKSFIL